MTDTLTLTLPMPPNVANARMHWRTKHKAQDEYRCACNALVLMREIPKPPRTPWPKATITSAMVLGNAMDDDNAMARHKFALDWLVASGYLVDDRRTCLRWTGLPTQTISRKQPASLTLTIERTA